MRPSIRRQERAATWGERFTVPGKRAENPFAPSRPRFLRGRIEGLPPRKSTVPVGRGKKCFGFSLPSPGVGEGPGEMSECSRKDVGFEVRTVVGARLPRRFVGFAHCGCSEKRGLRAGTGSLPNPPPLPEVATGEGRLNSISRRQRRHYKLDIPWRWAETGRRSGRRKPPFHAQCRCRERRRDKWSTK